jgi:hypothetical protein
VPALNDNFINRTVWIIYQPNDRVKEMTEGLNILHKGLLVNSSKLHQSGIYWDGVRVRILRFEWQLQQITY